MLKKLLFLIVCFMSFSFLTGFFSSLKKTCEFLEEVLNPNSVKILSYKALPNQVRLCRALSKQISHEVQQRYCCMKEVRVMEALSKQISHEVQPLTKADKASQKKSAAGIAKNDKTAPALYQKQLAESFRLSNSRAYRRAYFKHSLISIVL